ncbi:hypothetical protein [Tessaracoccus antarcticus]|uniref:Uncharacterized protein n=1 Tax=Tessaracoccus antarcticus TaxID=2479848 RepID=A0A3M0GH97_9ACTN|nr:hypothetical protein [Tessaracoccus antarcticus]RMB62102.1 hypothetical protein EAX62_05875 [Tessaracoccus antarcticus]
MQRWTTTHPVGFWISLIAVAVVLGIILPVSSLFYTSALVSGLVWHLNSAAAVKDLEPGRARSRIEGPRGRADVAPPPPLFLPASPHLMLPRGQKVQVTKEEHHLEHMGVALAEAGNRHIAATLHRMAPLTRRSTKERVQVRIDGRPVGELTPYMSEHFLPIIRVCDERGVIVACAAVVKGNQLKADVVLDAVRAVDLDDGWIEAHILNPGTP